MRERVFRSSSDSLSFSLIFSTVASAISFGIAAKKMRKKPAITTCEKPAENLRISLEKVVQKPVDFLRVSGGLAADKRLRSGGCAVDLNC